MTSLLISARAGGIPVIWTTCRYEGENMEDAGIFFKKAKAISLWHVSDNSGLGDWMPGLVPDEANGEVVVRKTHPSAFFRTDLEAILGELGVDTVVMAGCSTSGCVRATALDAMCRDFRPMVVREGCCDRGEKVQEGNLFDLDAKVGDVVGVSEACGKLGEGW